MSTPTPPPWIADGYDLRQKHGRMIAYFGPHHTPADEYPLSCRLQDEANCQWVATARNELAAAKGECERLKFASEGHLLKTIQQQAELARLRADLERFTGHGLLDCHAICDQRDAAIARAERAEAALAEWSVLNLWGGTPEIIHEFIKGQQNRIHHCQDLETELDRLRAEVERLEGLASWVLREMHQRNEVVAERIEQQARAERAEAALSAIACQKTHKELAEDETQEVADTADYQGAYDQMIAEARAAIDAAMKP